MLSPRISHSVSALAGVAVVFLSFSGVMRLSAPPCGNLPKGYPAMLAFELARSTADLQTVFGDTAGHCRDVMRSDLDHINRLDNLALIPAYGAFLFFFFIGMYPGMRKVARMGVVLTVIICLADWLENMCLFKLSANPEGARQWLSTLKVTTEVKWIGLGIAGIFAGILIARSRSLISRLAQVICCLACVFTVLSVPFPGWAGLYMVPAIAACWIVILIVDVFRLRPLPSRSRHPARYI